MTQLEQSKSTGPFLKAFVDEVCQHLGNDHSDNNDPTRPDLGGVAREQSSILRRVYRTLLRQRGLQSLGLSGSLIKQAINLIAPALAQWEWLYARLADDESQRLLVQLLAFRALGHRRVKLPLNSEEHWAGLLRFENLPATQQISADFLGWNLSLLDLTPLGLPISLYATPMMAHIQFGLEQYRCRLDGEEISAAGGDCVIDGGGCWGDSSLYFANRVGPDGRIFVFEFVPASLKVFEENLRLNPVLKSRITLVPHPMWSHSGEPVGYEQQGPGTRVEANCTNSSASAATLSIDDLVARESIQKVDLIKMDIEGSELPALRGARETILRFKPKMAIAVYHRLEDFFEVPQYLDSLTPEYRFHLRHFTIHAEETMLFASVPK